MPTADDLKAFSYRYRGFLWEAAKANYGIDETSLYDRTIYIAHYENHNRQVVDHFKDRPGDLLVLNVAEAEAMGALCAFLGVAHDGRPMPHRNRPFDRTAAGFDVVNGNAAGLDVACRLNWSCVDEDEAHAQRIEVGAVEAHAVALRLWWLKPRRS